MSSVEDFERERLRYCESMYSLEKERKQIMERKAQFYFGVITLFIGLLTLKGEIFNAVRSTMGQQLSETALIVIYSEMILFLASLISALVAILMLFRPERRRKPYPKNLITGLFAPDAAKTHAKERQGKGVERSLEADFLRDSALRFAEAVERNSAYNTKKSRWLIVAAIACLLVVLTYTLLIGSVLANLLRTSA